MENTVYGENAEKMQIYIYLILKNEHLVSRIRFPYQQRVS